MSSMAKDFNMRAEIAVLETEIIRLKAALHAIAAPIPDHGSDDHVVLARRVMLARQALEQTE